MLAAALDARPETARGFAARWLELEADLARAIAAERSSRLGRPERFRASQTAERLAAAAFAQQDPLQREIALDRARWQLLFDLTWEAPFGLGAVIAYGLQLRMVERLAALDEQTGRAQLDAYVATILAGFRDS